MFFGFCFGFGWLKFYQVFKSRAKDQKDAKDKNHISPIVNSDFLSDFNDVCFCSVLMCNVLGDV